MRRTIGLMAVICWGLFAASAGAAQPAIQKAPADQPQILPAAPATAAPGQPIIIQGPVMIAPVNPAPAPKKPRVLGRVASFAGSFFTPEHRCEPDGCPTPIGCGNAYSEFKYVFGSCRQFFGTGDATDGCLRKTTVPPPNSK